MITTPILKVSHDGIYIIDCRSYAAKTWAYLSSMRSFLQIPVTKRFTFVLSGYPQPYGVKIGILKSSSQIKVFNSANEVIYYVSMLSGWNDFIWTQNFSSSIYWITVKGEDVPNKSRAVGTNRSKPIIIGAWYICRSTSRPQLDKRIVQLVEIKTGKQVGVRTSSGEVYYTNPSNLVFLRL